MYQVYSIQRPGRPKWALSACALLLGLTLALAWVLVVYKARANRIELGPEQALPAGELIVRIPAGWQPITDDPDNLPTGVVAVYHDPQAEPGQDRRLYLFRSFPIGQGLPSLHLKSLHQKKDQEKDLYYISQTLNLGQVIRLEHLGPAAIGMLPAWSSQSINTLAEHPMHGPYIAVTARAAIDPRGRVLGLAVVSTQLSLKSDLTILGQIAEHLRLDNLDMADNTDAAMTGAGITFSLPDDGLLVKNDDPQLGRLLMMSHMPEDAWFLELSRVPLIEERTPAALVLDQAREITGEPWTDQKVAQRQHGDRAGQWATIPLRQESPARILITGVRMDNTTALLMTGRAENPERLEAIMNGIAADAQVGGLGDWSPPAVYLGRSLLTNISGNGLNHYERTEQMRYSLHSPRMHLGTYTVQRQSVQQDDGLWWRIATVNKLSSGRRVTEQWRIRDDVSTYDYDYESDTVIYHEQRSADQAVVKRRLVVNQSMTESGEIAVDENFGPEQVLFPALSQVAADPGAGPAIFSTITPLSAGRVYWLAQPLGLKTPQSGGPALHAVRLQQDYDPAPIIFYFDRQGRLEVVEFDDGLEQLLEETGPPRRNIRSR